jgi:ribonuclease Z
MTPLFQPKLLNPPFGDPALYVKLEGEGTALLFDVGDISRISAGLLFKITDVFITHTHIDHFVGIDHLLRLNLARERLLNIYGPPGIIANMTGKLKGYTWNLTENYPFMIDVHEIGTRHIKVRRFSCRDKFKPGPEQRIPFNATVINNSHYTVKTERLDHNGIPSLAYRLEEHCHININKDALNRLKLPVGPWLQTLKKSIREGCPDTTMIPIPGTCDTAEQLLPLGEICKQVVHHTPGEIIAYVSDCAATPANTKKIRSIAADADHFFCEAAFLDRDADKALIRGHLTAGQAGMLACECGAKALIPFHFSPRYESLPDEPLREARDSFQGN